MAAIPRVPGVVKETEHATNAVAKANVTQRETTHSLLGHQLEARARAARIAAMTTVIAVGSGAGVRTTAVPNHRHRVAQSVLHRVFRWDRGGGFRAEWVTDREGCPRVDVRWETIGKELRQCSAPWLPSSAHGRIRLVPYATTRRLDAASANESPITTLLEKEQGGG